MISTWHDRLVRPSDDWEGAIDANLEDADIILLLAKPTFSNRHIAKRKWSERWSVSGRQRRGWPQ